LSIPLLIAPAFAWEFTMKGAYVWEYATISQAGRQGFFGPFDVDNRAVGVANGNSLNAWVGSEANDMTVSGADGVWNTMYMDLDPEVRINPAVRVRGRYHVGQWWTGATTSPSGTTGVLDSAAGPMLVGSEYVNFLHPGVQRSFSPGYWNTLWLTAELPWGIITIGKRPSSWGMGLAWDGEDNRGSEALTLTTSYGPLRIAFGLYPARQGFEGYYNDYYDKGGLRYFDMVAPNVTYRNGPLDMGIILNVGPTRHRGPERLGATGIAATKATTETRDREDMYGGFYAKYNNGRFFFNTETNFYDRRDKVRRTDFRNGFVNRYSQDWRVALETGVLCGPSKLTLLYAWASGNDRRAGFRDNINQGTNVDPFSDGTAPAGITPRWTSTSLSNTSVFKPYSYLMVYQYGLGAFINADTRHGWVSDASVFAARYDYAVASNLNVYSSFFWADRVGNGYGWGFLVPRSTDAGPFPGNTFGLVQQQYKGTFTAGGTNPTAGAQSPNIPDNNLGWELDWGFDWKLLEGLLLKATFAYWQPGKWFNFACVSKTNPGWTAPAVGNGWGIQPDRNIDAIWGIQAQIVGQF
jgi:hypothetical protein